MFWALLLAAFTAQADNGVLAQVESFLGSVEFEQAFKCGDQAQMAVFVISCDHYSDDGNGMRSYQCKSAPDDNGFKAVRSVYDCETDQVGFLMDVDGSTSQLTRAQWEQAHRNVGEAFLNQAVEFSGYTGAKITLQSAQTGPYTLGRASGHPYTVAALTVSGQMAPPGLEGYPFSITLVKELPPVAQVVRFRMDNTSWFKVDGG
jgi:hypothetical protein